MTAREKQHSLLLTVGTGDMDRVDETLFAPLRKSMESGEWQRVILLPSQVTKEYAREFHERLAGSQIEVEPLPEREQENDADACFAHFDRVIAGLIAEGSRAPEILVDFTRGTKAMSAALVLAAVRHGLPQLRYISSSERDDRGMVVPGTEVVAEVRTDAIEAARRVDLAHGLFLRGNFAAVLDALPEPTHSLSALWPKNLLRVSELVRPLARFCGAWDRLDHAAARAEAEPLARLESEGPHRWRSLVPPRAVLQWVQDLARPFPKTYRKRAVRCHCLAVDLLANGERRIEHGQHEDAVIRGYRILELIGQTRLFENDLDSAALPPDHEAVERAARDLKTNNRERFSERRDGKLRAGRMAATQLLTALGDPLGKRLRQLGDKALRLFVDRNKSILTHGFTAVGPGERGVLDRLYGELEELLLDDDGAATCERLDTARFLNRVHGVE